ncbi:MAG TPA: 50S ribosomal protein L24e [Candidatus Nanoarchaeia archaeon]|nr:50S ribosomal protein L24e [Candidatus Nanoarchaeia archaeon]
MKCSFCGNELEPGTGKMFIKDDGRISFFCSSKCEKNTNMGRKPLRTKWTTRYEKGTVKKA